MGIFRTSGSVFVNRGPEVRILYPAPTTSTAYGELDRDRRAVFGTGMHVGMNTLHRRSFSGDRPLPRAHPAAAPA